MYLRVIYFSTIYLFLANFIEADLVHILFYWIYAKFVQIHVITN